MYMSYCRFEGTRQELNACLNNVVEHIDGEAEYKVSDGEIRQFRNMVVEFTEWLLNMGLLDNDGELNTEQLNNICEAMKHTKEEYENEDWC